MNYLLQNVRDVSAQIKSLDNRFYIETKEVLVPSGLDDIEVLPLWTKSLTEGYLLLCGAMEDSTLGYWLANFSDTLLSDKRELRILLNVNEWLHYQMP